ncbi:MAG TPA: ATP-binding protein [Ktedonobacteraceae bacterium]|nr:ATP-binding protein [Ktedonobacteraceae bacterium]
MVAEQIKHILTRIPVGVAILDCADLRLLYANAYLLSLLDEPFRSEGINGRQLDEVVSGEWLKLVLAVLQQVCITGQTVTYDALPYEGFLETRGRTYWRVAIGRYDTPQEQTAAPEGSIPGAGASLLVTIEDVTEHARSQLYITATQYISSVIAAPFALPRVLDRILQAVHEMVGSTRCAILLIDQMDPIYEEHLQSMNGNGAALPATVTLAAQKGVHLLSHDWHPHLGEHLLLSHVVRERHELIIEDTSMVPSLQFPLLDEDGVPFRPGSVLCVPIFEPKFDIREGFHTNGKYVDASSKGPVLGTIEVYHKSERGFPAEEVMLLSRFAQQAGLAIQNTRLFRRIDRLARFASRNARQRENVMQAIPDGVILYDARWRVAEANHEARRLLGWTDDVIGLPVNKAMARSTARFPEDITASSDLVAILERNALEGRVDELKIVGADGQAYTMRRSQAPIHDEMGNIFAFVVIYHDVTEQAAARERIEIEVKKRTTELAQRNEALQLTKAAQELASARLELLLERLPSGAMLISAEDLSISIINQVHVQLLQRIGALADMPDDIDLDQVTQDITGRNIEELLQSITLYKASGAILHHEEHPLAVALRGEANEAEIHATQPDGQPLYLLASAAPLRAADGSITSVVSVWHDITQMKMLERAREDFFTTLAHELKTPLANIRAHLSALQSNDLEWAVEEQLEFLQTADEQVERLAKMINYFLDASRVEAGALRLELEPILLPELFEDLQERLQALIDSSQRRLEIALPAHLPAVLADYELMMNVLTNLLSNAFRYAPEGDAVRIEAEALFEAGTKQPAGVELRVIDRGPGMSQERQAQLFTRFSTFASMRRPAADRPGQPATTGERRKGSSRWSPATGLGLYISKGIVEAHGGTLHISSSPGQGATFSFTLGTVHTMRRED